MVKKVTIRLLTIGNGNYVAVPDHHYKYLKLLKTQCFKDNALVTMLMDRLLSNKKKMKLPMDQWVAFLGNMLVMKHTDDDEEICRHIETSVNATSGAKDYVNEIIDGVFSFNDNLLRSYAEQYILLKTNLDLKLYYDAQMKAYENGIPYPHSNDISEIKEEDIVYRAKDEYTDSWYEYDDGKVINELKEKLEQMEFKEQNEDISFREKEYDTFRTNKEVSILQRLYNILFMVLTCFIVFDK